MTSRLPKTSFFFAMIGALLPVGCGTLERMVSPAPAPAAALDREATPEAFSSQRAWSHLRTLAALGPRPSGSAASQEALAYIRSQLEGLGLEIQEMQLEPPAPPPPPAPEEGEEAPAVTEAAEPRPPLHHIATRIESESPDSIVFLAHYDTRPDSPGANDGASGVALLLELAAQLKQRPLPYGMDFIFLDGESGVDPERPDLPLLEGSRRLVALVRDAGGLDEIRLALAFRQVADLELAIGRDLYSDRAQRDVFFEAARDLGNGDAFPGDRGFAEIVASHRPFLEAGMPRVVALMDASYGGEEPPGTHSGGAEDTPEHCSADSLQVVGETTLLALRRITARLVKVDEISGRAARRRAEAMEPAEDPAALPEEPSEAAPETQETPETPEESGPQPAEAPAESS